ncbi:MAG: polysaccharide deacetylase family protein [Peptostreptococcaceae bacterium]|nr:polysaccharide deacetylase family protein [Peptostreptococcaceae bacterium]
MKKIITVIYAIFLTVCITHAQTSNNIVGHTEITRWQDGKKVAISLTYDDNTINQFKIALPIMNKFGFKGTFFVITGSIPGSQYMPKFIGRPINEIIAETAKISTNRENFFERASATRVTGFADTYKYHVQAGDLYEEGKFHQAYKTIDDGYAKIRNGNIKASTNAIEIKKLLDYVLDVKPKIELVTWNELKKYAKDGNEIGGHSVSHSYLCILDSINLEYELANSREDLLNHIGPGATFSAECPFGLEDSRVMRFGHRLYPALRNRMPRPYLEEIDRSSNADPTISNKEYVQWQRGPLSNTPMKLMKVWVDKALTKDNIWIVFAFHGIDGIGWEPLTHEELNEYFEYIKKRESYIWEATFKNVTKYMRERMAASVRSEDNLPAKITVHLIHSLNETLYNFPLTLKTYVPRNWNMVRVSQGKYHKKASTSTDSNGNYVIYRATPNGSVIVLTKIRKAY